MVYLCSLLAGISLPLDQWKRLKEQIEEVDEAVKDLS